MDKINVLNFSFEIKVTTKKRRKKIKQNIVFFSVNKTTHPTHFIVNSLLNNLCVEKIENTYVELTYHDRLNENTEVRMKHKKRKNVLIGNSRQI